MPSAALPSVCRPRTEAGLPEEGFVFCCFNNIYKITPEVFDIWMRLLRGDRRERAVAASRTTLPQRAICGAKQRPAGSGQSVSFSRRGRSRMSIWPVTASPICSSTRCPTCAHTTASDALWAGLPVADLHGERLCRPGAGESCSHAADCRNCSRGSSPTTRRWPCGSLGNPVLSPERRQKVDCERLMVPAVRHPRFTHKSRSCLCQQMSGPPSRRRPPASAFDGGPEKPGSRALRPDSLTPSLRTRRACPAGA